MRRVSQAAAATLRTDVKATAAIVVAVTVGARARRCRIRRRFHWWLGRLGYRIGRRRGTTHTSNSTHFFFRSIQRIRARNTHLYVVDRLNRILRDKLYA